MRTLLKTSCWAAMCLGLVACGSKPIQLPPVEPPPPPTVVQLTLQADALVNQDSRGRSTPVVVRYYLLSHPAAFESADFFSLFDADDKALGATIVLREEVTLRPGEKVSTTLLPKSEAKSLAVFAAYREPNQTSWRAVVPIQANKVNTFQASIGRDKVSITSPR